jgi:hypothetical protein
LQQEAQKQYTMQYGSESNVTGGNHGKYEGYTSGETQEVVLQTKVENFQDTMKQLQSVRKQITELDTTSSSYAYQVKALSEKEQELSSALSDQASEVIPLGNDYITLLDQMGATTDEQEALRSEILAATEGYYNATEGATSYAEATSVVTSALSEESSLIQQTTDALTAYQEVTSAAPEESHFQSYSEAFSNFKQMLADGETQTKEFYATAELIFGRDLLNSINWSVDAMQQYVPTLETLYGNAESYGMGIYEIAQQLADSSGDIYDKWDNVIAHIEQDNEGNWKLDIPEENFEAFGELVGTTGEGIIAVLEAVSAVTGGSFTDFDDMISSLENLGKITETTSGKAMSLEVFNEITSEMDAKQVALFSQALAAAGVSLVDTEADAETLVGQLEELGLAVENADGDITIDFNDLTTMLQQLGLSQTQIQAVYDKINESSNVQFTFPEIDTSNLDLANKEVQNIHGSVQGLLGLNDSTSQGAVMAVGNAADTAKGQVDDTTQSVDELGSQTTDGVTGSINNIATAASNATSQVSAITNAINNIPTSKTVTINIKRNGIFSSLFGESDATGTDNAKGGKTLVGEEYSPDGTPRPEIVVYKNKAQVVGAQGPEIVDLPAGAQVIPYKTTKKVLSGEGGAGDKFPAFWTGTASSAQIAQYTGSSSSSKNSSSSSSSKTSSSTSSSSSTKSSSSSKSASTTATSTSQDVSDAIKDQKEVFDEEIEILEYRLFLLQKSNASYEEQSAAIKQIQTRLHEQAEWYRGQGLDSEHEYIRSASKDWWSYADDLEDLWSDTLDDMSNELSDELDISEHQIFLLEKQDNTQQQRIAIYKQAQDKIHALAEKYRAMGLDENSEYIRELQKQWWELADEIEDVYEEIKDIIEGKANDLETTFSYMVTQINKEIDNLQDYREERETYWEEQIDALNDANDALEDQKELEEALKDLETARAKKNLVYKNGYFQYVADVDAVSEAADKVAEINRKQDLQKQIDDLEDQKDAELKLIDDQIQAWQDYADAWGSVVDDYEEEQDRLLAEQVLGIKLEGDNWKTRLDNLADYVKKYNEYMDSINSEAYKTDEVAWATLFPNAVNVAVKQGGSAPSGLQVGDRVTTSGGTYQINKVNADGTYSSTLVEGGGTLSATDERSTEDNWAIIGSSTGDYGDRVIPTSTGSSTTASSSSGKTVAVMKGGGAPPGLSIGDKVATAGGTYRITGINADGTYTSEKIDDRKYTGERSTADNVVVIPGYSGGTVSAKGGLSLVGEDGPELRVLNPGDAIFPNDMLNNLMQWGTLDPTACFTLPEVSTGQVQNISVANITLPGVTDAQQFVKELKNFSTRAIQYSAV